MIDFMAHPRWREDTLARAGACRDEGWAVSNTFQDPDHFRRGDRQPVLADLGFDHLDRFAAGQHQGSSAVAVSDRPLEHVDIGSSAIEDSRDGRIGGGERATLWETEEERLRTSLDVEGSKGHAPAKEIVDPQDRDIGPRYERDDVGLKPTSSLNDDWSSIAGNDVRVGHDVPLAHDETAALETTSVVLDPKNGVGVFR